MTVRRPRGGYTESLRAATAKDFRGGLNTYDSPLNLNSRYWIESRNMYPDSNGVGRLRFGTSLLAETGDYLDEIINMTYYLARIVAVGANGEIVVIDGAGNVTLVWDATIAAGLPGSPAGWSTGLTACNFTQFGGELIICNGVDKPLIMNASYAVSYLQDAGTGSNVNVPRALYCVTHNGYLVLAVTPTDTTTLFIGNKGSAGTFVGDPPPNDAVNFNTSAYVDRGLVDITGLASFRDRLIVTFNETILAIELGQYDDASTPNHVPRVDDTIDNFGVISQRCMVNMGDDLVFIDSSGVNSVQRALVTGTLSPVRESQLVAEDVQRAMQPFTLTQLQQYVFAVYDRLNEQIFYFIPKSVTVDSDTDNHVYVYCYDRSRRFRAMAYYDQMAYRSGCRSSENRVFLSRGSNVYYYHNAFDPLYVDYAVEGPTPWDDDTPWDDGTFWEGAGDLSGLPIPFSASTPWSDMRMPDRIKSSRYVQIIAEGAASATVEMFTDRFSDPIMSMAMTQTGQPAGPGTTTRPMNNEQLYAWPMTFRRARLRVSGIARWQFNLVAITVYYAVGGPRR